MAGGAASDGRDGRALLGARRGEGGGTVVMPEWAATREFGEPVAGGVGDVGSFVQSRPHAHDPFLAGAGDPALTVQAGDIDRFASGEWVGVGHGAAQGATTIGARACASAECWPTVTPVPPRWCRLAIR